MFQTINQIIHRYRIKATLEHPIHGPLIGSKFIARSLETASNFSRVLTQGEASDFESRAGWWYTYRSEKIWQSAGVVILMER